MQDPLRKMLDEAGYDNRQVDDDFDYADPEGWSAFDEPDHSVLTGFIDDEDRAGDENLAPFEPVGWDED